MPIYEYTCGSCGHRFEAIVQRSSKPECPKCDGKKLAKHLSLFAVGGPAASEAAPAGSPCERCDHPGGRGACAFE